MDILTNILAFVFSLGIIIFVHEAGHLLMARAFDMRVLAFSLGFGKKIFGFTRGETEYKVSIIPLGGYVKLGGEDPDEVSDDPRDFSNKPRWQRILVYIAGPAMNVVLAVLLIAVLFMVGIEVPNPTQLPPEIGGVYEESPAAVAGLAQGDRILTIDGEEMEDWQAVQMAVISAPDRPLKVDFERDGERRTVTLVPERQPRYELGWSGLVPPATVRVKEVVEERPAERAGFQRGDELLSISGRAVASPAQVIAEIVDHPGEELEVEVMRDGQRITLAVTPEGEAGGAQIGILFYPYFQRYPPMQAVMESFSYNYNVVVQTFDVLGKVITGRLAAKGALSGPIEIAAISGAEARRGFDYLLHLMAIISISIAIINLLPVPILDGGQIVILTVESIMRRDLSLKVKERLAQVGFVLIMALMLTVIFFDLQKNLPGILPGN